MNVLDNMNIDQIPLPAVIGAHLVSHPAAAPAQAPDNGPKFLLVCSRDLDDDEKSLLRLYGGVLEFDDCHINIPLQQLIEQNNVSYIVFDIRQKSHRMALSKEAGDESYHIIAVIHKWEEFDDFIDDANAENCLSSLPPKQAFKRDFDKLLLEKKIRKPSCAKNVLRIFLKVLGGWGKK